MAIDPGTGLLYATGKFTDFGLNDSSFAVARYVLTPGAYDDAVLVSEHSLVTLTFDPLANDFAPRQRRSR